MAHMSEGTALRSRILTTVIHDRRRHWFIEEPCVLKLDGTGGM